MCFLPCTFYCVFFTVYFLPCIFYRAFFTMYFLPCFTPPDQSTKFDRTGQFVDRSGQIFEGPVKILTGQNRRPTKCQMGTRISHSPCFDVIIPLGTQYFPFWNQMAMPCNSAAERNESISWDAVAVPLTDLIMQNIFIYTPWSIRHKEPSKMGRNGCYTYLGYHGNLKYNTLYCLLSIVQYY